MDNTGYVDTALISQRYVCILMASDRSWVERIPGAFISVVVIDIVVVSAVVIDINVIGVIIFVIIFLIIFVIIIIIISIVVVCCS